ncbi:MAG: DegV family protein [Chloroflexota bacterium]|nr:DegV family protein [Chloroflexota bacterium]
MSVKIVTDSTADLPNDVAERLGITVIPQNVHFGTETYKDNVTITPDDFYAKLIASKELPKTSQASPGDFKEVYDRVGDGADGIVSIHVAASLSGTYNSAVQARDLTTATCPIEVIDTASASMGEGLVAVAAAEAANGGAGVEEVAEIARSTAERARCMALLETLEYLQKGGRIGKAQAMLGSILQIKPMIIVQDGEVHELGKARTFTKGLAKLRETVLGMGPADSLAVIYSTTPDAAQAFADSVSEVLPAGASPYLCRFGPALGVHTGPGGIGVALVRSGA